MQDLSRALPLAGASNFRDLGGYQGLNGQTLRWRRLFRSDHLAALTPADHAVLQALGISHTIDFRGDSERAAQAYALPGVAYHPLTIEPTVIHRALALQQQGLFAVLSTRDGNLPFCLKTHRQMVMYSYHFRSIWS